MKVSCAAKARDLVLAGGTVTLASAVSGREFIYLVGVHPRGGHVVRLLTNGEPEFVGVISPHGEFRLAAASGFPAASLAVVAFTYFWRAASCGNGRLPAQLAVTVEPAPAPAYARRRA